MNTDEICQLLLRLQPGAALILPPEVAWQTVEHAIGKAASHQPTWRFSIGEHLVRANSVKPPRRYVRVERLDGTTGT